MCLLRDGQLQFRKPGNDGENSPPLALAVERKTGAILVLAHHLALGVLRGLLGALEGVVPPRLSIVLLRGDVLRLLT